MTQTLGVSVADSASVADVFGRLAGIRLDIGCGANKQPGWYGIDFQPLPGVDLVHDLMVFPWPLPDESVLVAMASHVVEHIPPHNLGFIKFMNEVWRVLKPGGEIIYLGTPQTEESLYNKLPERGYVIRIWPARYPKDTKHRQVYKSQGNPARSSPASCASRSFRLGSIAASVH